MTQPSVTNFTTRGQVAILTISRPQAMNALNADVLAGLRTGVERAIADPRLRALVITGEGKRAFCAGADLKELQGLDAAAAEGIFHRGQAAMRAIESAPIPIIAAVNGVALGGGFELALACTLVVVHREASLGLPETGLGLMPGYGGTQRLTRRIGSARAALVMLTGARLSAEDAYHDRIAAVRPTDDALGAAIEIGEQIAAQGPRAVRAVLTAMRQAAASGLEAGLELETALASQLPFGVEGAEGISAFLDRRTPNFPDFDTAGGLS